MQSPVSKDRIEQGRAIAGYVHQPRQDLGRAEHERAIQYTPESEEQVEQERALQARATQHMIGLHST